MDTRPRFLWIATPSGVLRIRRMPSPQLFTQLHNFNQLGMTDDHGWRGAETPAQVVEMTKFLQRCIVREQEDILAFPGPQGLQELSVWSLSRRREIAGVATSFMEV